MLATTRLFANQETYVACNFNCQTEALLKIISSHVRCKSGNISKTVQTTDLHSRQDAIIHGLPNRPISDDHERFLRLCTYCKPLKYDSSYIRITIYKISTAIARLAVSLQQQSFLHTLYPF